LVEPEGPVPAELRASGGPVGYSAVVDALADLPVARFEVDGDTENLESELVDLRSDLAELRAVVDE
jgi:hypothetical protein